MSQRRRLGGERERRDDAEVAAAPAAQRPEQVGLGLPDAVSPLPSAVTTCADTSLSHVRPELAGQYADPAAERQPGDPDGRARPGRQAATLGGERRRRPPSAAPRRRSPRSVAPTSTARHRPQVDDQRLVRVAVAGVAVPARARGDRHPPARRPRRTPGRPPAACTARSRPAGGCRTAGCTTGRGRVAVVAGQHEAAGQLLPQRCPVGRVGRPARWPRRGRGRRPRRAHLARAPRGDPGDRARRRRAEQRSPGDLLAHWHPQSVCVNSPRGML